MKIALLFALLAPVAAGGPDRPPYVLGATQELGGGKASLTPAQKKIGSELLQEIQRRADPAYVPGTPPTSRIKVDEKGRALVDVRVDVTPATRQRIIDLEGTIVSTSAEYRSIVAWVSLSKLEALAKEDDVVAIRPAPEPALRHRSSSFA